MAEVRDLVARLAGVEASHDAVLVASELATNAVRHARTPYTVKVEAAETIRIEVTDHIPDLPYIPDPSQPSMGLRIVAQASGAWGIIEIEDDGKTLWSEVNR